MIQDRLSSEYASAHICVDARMEAIRMVREDVKEILAVNCRVPNVLSQWAIGDLNRLETARTAELALAGYEFDPVPVNRAAREWEHVARLTRHMRDIHQALESLQEIQRRYPGTLLWLQLPPKSHGRHAIDRERSNVFTWPDRAGDVARSAG